MSDENQERTAEAPEGTEEESTEQEGLRTTVTREDDCRCVINIEADADYLKTRYDEELNELQEQVTLPGFRRGKAPLGLVERRLGSSVREEVLSSVMTEAYDQAVEENDLDVVARLDVPDLEEYEWEVGQPAEFEFTCEVLPEVDLEKDDYKDLTVEVPALEVTEEMVEQEMEGFAQQFADLEEVTESGIDREDLVACELTVLQEGAGNEEEEGEERESVWTGEFHFRPVDERIGPFTVEGIQGSLTGSGKGTEATLDAMYEPDSDEEVLEPMEGKVGETVPVKVKVTAVYRRQVPELNEAFTEQYGLPSPEEIETTIRQNLERRIQNQKQSITDRMLTGTILDNVNFVLPDSLVERATREEQRRIMLRALRQGESMERAENLAAQSGAYSREVAERNLKVSYLLSEIAEQERIYVTESELREQVRALGARRGWDEDQAWKYLEQQDMLDSMRSNLRESKTLEFLKENSTIEEISPEEFEERYSDRMPGDSRVVRAAE